MSGLSQIHETAAAAMQASTAFPPARRTSAPASGGERMTGCQHASHGASVRFAAMGDVSFAADERATWRLRRLPFVREAVLCTGIAAITASLLVWLGPRGGDLAAHEYQSRLFTLHGFTLWDNFWYAGRYAFVNYSVLYYPLASLFGIGLLSVLTVALAAGAFARLLEREWGPTARWASRCFALLWPGVILAAELPLALGVLLALLCLLALQAGRRWPAAALILLTLAASPVAFVAARHRARRDRSRPPCPRFGCARSPCPRPRSRSQQWPSWSPCTCFRSAPSGSPPPRRSRLSLSASSSSR